MSAHTQRPTGQILSITNGSEAALGTATQSPGADALAAQAELDAFVTLSQQIEGALAHGRTRCQKLKNEIAALQGRNESLLRDSEAKLEAAHGREHQLKRAIATHQDTERRLTTRIQELTQQTDNLRSELESSKRYSEEIRAAAKQKLETFSQREQTFKAEILARRSTEAELRSSARAKEEQLMGRVTQLQQALDKAQQEVDLFKSSWTRVLQMERDARAHLAQKEQADARLSQLESGSRELRQELEKSRDETRKAQQELASEREASQARLRQLNDSAQEKISGLSQEVQELRSQIDQTVGIEGRIDSLTEEFQKIASARQQLQEERNALKTQLEQAMRQMHDAQKKSDQLKKTYPLRDLLAHKEAELTRAVRELKNIPKDSPGRDKAEDIVETLSDQRDQLRRILQNSEMSR